MKANTGLLALGLFAVAGMVTVSCGGSSDSDDDNGTAGTSAGTTSKAGNSAAGTTSSTAGTANGTGGTGNGNGGTANNNGGRNNNNGGANDFPGLGGAGFDVPGCPAGAADGATCAAGDPQACQLNDTTYCGCRGTTWTCLDPGDLGAGGAGPVFGQATCPAGAKTGDACTNGPGLCTGQQCFCGQNSMVTCF